MTEITFLCRHNVSFSAQKPVFHRRENNNYIFNFETPLACLPESVDCLVSDDTGNQYDLSPLAKDDGNWEAVDMQSGVKYYINVCRLVNSVTSETHFCPGIDIFALHFGDISKMQPDLKPFSDSNIFVRNYRLKKTYNSLEGVLSRNVLYYQQLSIPRYQVSFYTNLYFE